MNTANHPLRIDDELQSLHLAALRTGSLRVALRVGEAESLLWEASAWRIIRRAFRDGTRRSEIHVLLGDAQEPLAWWQRCSGAPAAGPDWAWPLALANVSLYVIDGRLHDLGVDAVLDELAAIAGRDPGGYRAALVCPQDLSQPL